MTIPSGVLTTVVRKKRKEEKNLPKIVATLFYARTPLRPINKVKELRKLLMKRGG
jgi:hypothetical protein